MHIIYCFLSGQLSYIASEMRLLTLFALGLATIFPSLSTAHTLFTTLFVNDVSQGDGTCVRMPKVGSTCTSPIASLDSPDMACGKLLSPLLSTM